MVPSFVSQELAEKVVLSLHSLSPSLSFSLSLPLSLCIHSICIDRIELYMVGSVLYIDETWNVYILLQLCC